MIELDSTISAFIDYVKWKLQVVGAPVTLNGDLKNQFLETTVGFDTICKVFHQSWLDLKLRNNSEVFKCE